MSTWAAGLCIGPVLTVDRQGQRVLLVSRFCATSTLTRSSPKGSGAVSRAATYESISRALALPHGCISSIGLRYAELSSHAVRCGPASTALADTHAAVCTSKSCSSSNDLPGKQSCPIIRHPDEDHTLQCRLGMINQVSIWPSTIEVINPAMVANVHVEIMEL